MGWNGSIVLSSLVVSQLWVGLLDSHQSSLFLSCALLVWGAKMQAAIEEWHVLNSPSFTGRSQVKPGDSTVWYLADRLVLTSLWTKETRGCGRRRTLEKRKISLGMTEIRGPFSIFEESRESSSHSYIQKGYLQKLFLQEALLPLVALSVITSVHFKSHHIHDTRARHGFIKSFTFISCIACIVPI
jgi:hypothetical protein